MVEAESPRLGYLVVFYMTQLLWVHFPMHRPELPIDKGISIQWFSLKPIDDV